MQQLTNSLLQISMFITPILWSADQLKGRASALATYNPLYHIIAVVRDPMMGKMPQPLAWMVVVLIAIFGWTLTVFVMSKFRHRIVYWL
jgi:lipopolysaccharide transport system permease protein